MAPPLADSLEPALRELNYGCHRDVHLLGQNGVAQADLIAYGGQVRNLRTACFAAHLSPSHLDPRSVARRIGSTGALHVYVAQENGNGQFWRLAVANGSDYTVIPGDDVPIASAGPYLLARPDQFAAAQVLRGKRALPPAATEAAPLQLSFGALGVSDFQEEQTEQTLTDLLNDVVRAATTRWRTQPPLPKDADERLGRLFLRYIAACSLIDKGLTSADRMNLHDTLHSAREFLPNFLDDETLALIPADVSGVLWERLQGVRFELLTGSMLAGMYEKGLVTTEFREAYGVHYTPLSVRRLMWEAVRPHVAELPPDERIVLDPTSGSGGFLLTAYDGLAELENQDVFAEHDVLSLRRRLLGVDSDAFACDIARLALILQSCPVTNDWRIQHADFRKWQHADSRPRIVIGNPPFQDLQAREVALKSLQWVAPGGVIALVLPRAFISNVTYRKAFEQIISRCSIEHIIELPERLFSAQQATCVLIARRKSIGEVSAPYRLEYRRLNRELPPLEQRRLLRSGDVRFSINAPLTDSQLREGELDLPEVWSKVRHLGRTEPLSQVASFREGLILREKREKQPIAPDAATEAVPVVRAPEVSVDPKAGYLPFLKNARDYIAPFRITQAHYLEWAPERLYYAGKVEWWSPNKVVMGRHVSDKRRWRLFGAVDRVGVAFESRLFGAFPRRPRWTADALLCFLSSNFANAWYSSHSRQVDLTTKHLQLLPVPRFSEPEIEHLDALGRALEQCESGLAERPKTSAEAATHDYMVNLLLREVDTVVCRAAGLGDVEVGQIQGTLVGEDPRPGWVREPRGGEVLIASVGNPAGPHRLLETIGMVLAVDRRQARAALRVDGLDVDMPVCVSLEALPEALTQSGARFRAAATLAAPDCGSVIINGIRVAPSADEIRRRLADLAGQSGTH